MSQQRRTGGMQAIVVAAAGLTLCCLISLCIAKLPATGASPVDVTVRKDWMAWGTPEWFRSRSISSAALSKGAIVQASHIATPGANREEAVPRELPPPERLNVPERVWAAVEENAARYPDIPSAPLGVRMQMSPLAQALYHQQMREESAARRERQFAETLRKIRERQKVWQGTTAEVTPDPRVSTVDRLSAVRFVKLFESDPPAPEVRKQHFAAFFQPDAEQRCVSWRLVLKSAREMDDGWLVDLDAHVNLLGADFAISMGTTKEVWHVSHDHELTFVEGTPGEDRPAKVDCRP